MKKVPYVAQMQETECGPCCVSMVLKYHGSKINIKEIRKIIETGRGGASFSDLKEVFEEYKYEAKVFKASYTDFRSRTSKNPTILFWNKNHFVVLEKIIGDYYYIVDPATGREKILKKPSKKVSQDFS